MVERTWLIDIVDKEEDYSGIQRSQTGIASLKCKLMNQYFDLIDNEMIMYSEDNATNLLSLLRAIKSSNPNSEMEIILFGVGTPVKGLDADFLGYDITGDSNYISLIKLMCLDTNNSFVKSNECFRLLNQNGLFENENNAWEYITEIKKYYSDEFEQENNWHPVKVYRVNNVLNNT